MSGISGRKGSEERFRLIVESAPNAMVMVNDEGRITLVNSRTESLFGYARGDLLGQPIEMLVPERYRAMHQGHVSGFFTELQPRPMGAGRDLCGLRKDGTEVSIEIGLNPLTMENGSFVLASIVDISKHKKLEEQLEAARAELELRVEERTAELRESEARYRAIVESGPECVKLVDRECRLLAMNPAGLRMIEVEALEEVQGLDVRDLLLPEYHVLFQAGVDAVFRGEATIQEFEIISLKGTRRWLQQHASPLWNTKKPGEVQCMLAVTHDVTSEKQAMAALRKERDFAEGLVDTSPVIILALDSQARITFVNQHFQDLTGYHAAEVEGKNWFETFLLPSDQHRIQVVFERALNGESTRGSINPILTRMGKAREIEWYDRPLHDSDGHATGLLVIGLDITERIASERRDRDRNELLRTVIDTTPDWIFVKDLEHRFLMANRAFTAALNLTPAEIIGRRDTDFWPLELWEGDPDKGFPGFVTTDRQAFDGETVHIPDDPVIMEDGLLRHFDTIKTPLRDSDGRVIGMVGYARDVTQQLLMLSQLRHSKTRLKEAQEIAQIGNWELDLIQDALHWSDQVFRIFEIEKEEFGASYQTFLDVIHPDDRETVHRVYTNALETREPYEITHRLRMPDGQIKYVHERCLTEYDVEGKPIRSLGTVQDITLRWQAEEAAREVKLAIDASITPTICADASGTMIYANGAACRSLGYAENELLGLHLWDVESTASSECWQEWLAGVREHGHLHFEGRNRRKDGSLFPVDVYVNYVESEGGRIWFSAYDISERLASENALREALDEVSQLKERLEVENVVLKERMHSVLERVGIVGQSAAIQRVLSQAHEVAKTDSSVLIFGETGTGKELLAEAIHDWSNRKQRPFVRIACAAIPATLLESELFGREKGAFTGALTKQVGRFEAAEGGTLFLDEIGELPADIQVKLLRVLDNHQFERLGSSKTLQANVRIIAATNRNLEQAIREGLFREDLFHRLNVFPLTIPPLRERAEDIPELVWSFVKNLSEKMGKSVSVISPDLMSAIQRQPWPGNVRELRNAIERAMILSNGPELYVELPKAAASSPLEEAALDAVERAHIIKILESTGWRIRGEKGAAKRLDLKPTTLESRMSRLGIERPHR